MTQTERCQAFDRFYAGGKEGRGSGLGLSIVRRLAAGYGGTVSLLEGPDGGTDAVVVFQQNRVEG